MKNWLWVAALGGVALQGQVTVADYERANGLRKKYEHLAVNVAGPATWIGDTHRFWYAKSVAGGNEFVVVDADSGVKKPAFDQEKLAAGLAAASGEKATALDLPFNGFRYVDHEHGIEFVAYNGTWRCGLSDYACKKTGPAPNGFRRRPPYADGYDPPAEFENDVFDGMVYLSPQQGARAASAPEASPEVKASPDGKWEALIQNYNVFIRPKGAKDSKDARALSWDGSEGNYYIFRSIAWSPDSKHLAAYRVHPGYRREVHYIESSPKDQLQPKYSSIVYAKPGDPVDIDQPMLFDVETKKQTVIDNSLFPNPYSLSNPVWWKDGRGFTFEYNQRGHQVYRLIEVNVETGAARVLISEESKTFIDYRPLVANQRDTGKKVRHDVDDGKEIVWMSERDGWAHLYLYDGRTGKLKNQITKGDWVVRAVDKVDDQKRQIWFEASGMVGGEDPYFVQGYRINFDGTGLTRLTKADAYHALSYSDDMKYYVDTWSRVDLPAVSELHRTDDNKTVSELEHGDMTALVAAGWHPPEPFAAKGRDGKTDIWGVIWKPAHLDITKKYPVVEFIYAGPQGSFVPKTFSPLAQPLTELGFVVVQMDGMGTNNRSKAFHDTAWHNLADAGFPDRILWHKAVAAKYPWYDISRVGIFGTSAGGQNAMGALLFHPEFYKVAVSNSGCHDNRMDKIWWNEQWMGWPLGPHYAASSNVDNAHLLQGKLLLVVGEMDNNVDPSSTIQVVNALIKANKKFNLLYVPGGGHGAGGEYGQRLLEDFFVHNLLGAEPPDWNREPEESQATGN